MTLIGWRFFVVLIPTAGLVWALSMLLPSGNTHDLVCTALGVAGIIGGMLWQMQSQLDGGKR